MKFSSLTAWAIFIALISVFGIFEAKATHLAGVDLTYSCQGGLTYDVRLVWYRDCDGIAAPFTDDVVVSSASLGFTSTVQVNQVPGTGQEITIPCSSALSTCQGGTEPGVQEWEYTGTIVLPAAATDWVFSIRRVARNTAITNVDLTTATNGAVYTPGGSGPGIYTEATLDNVNAPCNNSAFFSIEPISFLCLNQTFNYNQGGIDVDGDSLVFSLVNPADDFNSDLIYFPPFSFNNPVSTTSGLIFDTQTGSISLTPTQQEVSVLAVRADEYRNGILIGSTTRDIQIWVIDCGQNSLPTASGINGTNDFNLDVCAGTQFCFDIFSNDADPGDIVTMTWNQGIPGGSFTTAGSPLPTGTFCWNPTQADVSANPYSFSVTVQDNACPTSGTQVFTYSINVSGLDVDLGPDTTLCASSYLLTPTIGNASGNLTYQWSTGSSDPSITVTTSGTYAVTVADATGCSGTADVIVTLNNFSGQPIFTNNFIPKCSGEGILLDAGFGSAYDWSTGEVTQTILAVNPGVYSVTVTDQVGCQNIDSVVIVDFPTPQVDIGPNQTVCAGDSGSFDAGAGFNSYLWSTGATTQSITVTQTGTYAVTVTSEDGCAASDQATFFAQALPQIDLGPDIVVCEFPVTLRTLIQFRLNYFWNTGQTGSSIQITSPGTYILSATNGLGCTNSDTIEVTASTTGLADIIPYEDTVICNGTSIIIDAGAGFDDYLWSTGSTSQFIQVSQTGDYVISVRDTFGCDNTDTVGVFFAPNPVVDLGPDQIGCNDVAVTLDAGAGFASYLWSTGAQTQTIDVTTVDVYSVTVTNSFGCSGSDDIVVEFNPPIVVDLGPTILACEGDIVFVDAGAGFASYSWSTGESTQDIAVTETGTYAVTVTDSLGCEGFGFVQAIFNLNPVVELGTDITACDGDVLILDAGQGFSTYLWNTGDRSQILTVDQTGTYSVTVGDSLGCTGSDTIEVIFAPNPIVNLGPDVLACPGQPITINAGAGFGTYAWSTGEQTQTITVNSLGVYGVTVTDNNGCTGSDSVVVEIAPQITFDLGPDRLACEGEIVDVVGPLGFVDYVWQNAVGQVVTTGLVLTTDTTGLFILTVSDSNGCTGASSIQVTIADNPSIDLGPDITICPGDSAVLSVTTIFENYVWSTGATSPTITVGPGVYSITVFDAIGCEGSDTISVFENPPITVIATSDGDCAPLSGVANAAATGGTPPFQYSWDGPNGFTGNGDALTGLDIGTYTVTATDFNGCTGTATTTIVLPSIVVDAGPDQVICAGESATLTATGATFYSWSPSTGLSSTTGASVTANPTQTTTYTVVGQEPSVQLIQNGDFENGNLGFTNDYVFSPTDLFPEGTYAVVTNPAPLQPAFLGNDHTTGQGLFLAVNGSTTQGDNVWCQDVSVVPNTDYNFSTWIATLVASSPAELEFSINGQLLGTSISAPNNQFEWTQFFANWNSSTFTTATICIVNNNTIAGGNDFGLDDISFTATCFGTDTVTVVVADPLELELGDDDTLCLGSALVIEPAGQYETYLWSDGSSGSTLSVTMAGTYGLTVTDEAGCSASDSISIFAELCCFPSGFGNLFTTIDATNNLITSDQVWDGKYYVTEDVIVSNGATLDLTNVDIVFLEETGITFLDDSEVRANNSVLRACDLDEYWDGITMLGNSGGVFNESVIKNAETGLEIQTAGVLNVSDNQFYNNATAIYLNEAGDVTYNGGITNNVFVSNQERPDYLDSTGTSLNDFFGIRMFNTIMGAVISQNEFVNSSNTGVVNNFFYGIYINTSGLTASSNTFTNMYRAFDVTGNGSSVSIDNNTIEYTQNSYNDIYAVRLSDINASPVLLEGNKITFSSLGTGANTQAAIYANNVRNVIISNNEISGFARGLRIGGGSRFVEVFGNTIKEANVFGMLLLGGRDITVSDNTLKGLANIGIDVRNVRRNLEVTGNSITNDDYSNTIGVRYFITTGGLPFYFTVEFADNCIRNTSTAMLFRSNPASLDIPTIRNNYLYNYEDHGIWSDNFEGAIGSCLNYPAEAGGNSFISNNLAPFGSAVDVRSDNATITLSGNSANLVISFPTVLVNTSCNTTSTADCGNQIGNNEDDGRSAGPLSQRAFFRNMVEANYPLTLNGANYSLNNDHTTALAVIDADERVEYAISIMEILNENTDQVELEVFAQSALTTANFTANEMNKLRATYYSLKGDWTASKYAWNTYSPSNAAEVDRVAIELIKLDLKLTDRTATGLTDTEIITLSTIDDAEQEFAAVARDLIHMATGEHDYKFKTDDDNSTYGPLGDGAGIEGNTITVMPNPVSGSELQINYITEENIENVTIVVTDLLGRTLINEQVEFNNGVMKLGVSELAPASYFISISAGGKYLTSSKFIKSR